MNSSIARKHAYIFIASFTVIVLLLFKSVAVANELILGVVPQQSVVKLTRIWSPLAKLLSSELNVPVKLHGSADISVFESRLVAREFDIAYVNPKQYVLSKKTSNFRVLAREKDKKLQGIIVVRKNSQLRSLDELSGKNIVFPKHAFAADLITRAYLKKQGIPHISHFAPTHDAAYSLVALGKMDAAGGVVRTFNSQNQRIKENLIVFKKLDGLTPHAFIVNPQLNETMQAKIQSVLLKLQNEKIGQTFLQAMGFNSLVKADDSEWNDIRELMGDDL